MRSAEAIPVVEGSPEWLAERKKGITASEIPAVLGISPWQSAFDLYHYKAGHLTEQPDREELEWGRALEGLLLNRFQHRHPEFRVRTGNLFRSLSRRWQMATPDGLSFGADADPTDPIAVVQVKTAGYKSPDEWGDEGTDRIPEHYRAQVLWEMDTLGCHLAYVPVLFSGRHYAEYVVEYDEIDVTEMRQHAEAFLKRLREDSPPPLDWAASTKSALQRLYAELVDTSVEVPGHAVRTYQSWRDTEQVAKQMRAQAENQLRSAMGHAARGTVNGEVVLTRSRFERSGIDVRALRADYPDVAEEMRTSTTVDRINVRSRPTAGEGQAMEGASA